MAAVSTVFRVMCRAPGLIPGACMVCCTLDNVVFLCCSQVTRYLEFKTVDGSYVVKGSKVNKVRRGDGGGLWLGLAWPGLATYSVPVAAASSLAEYTTLSEKERLLGKNWRRKSTAGCDSFLFRFFFLDFVGI